MAAAAHNPSGSKELKDQAAAAALYVTEPQRRVKDVRQEAKWPLDSNGKLTSAGAAASLKRAEAKDLPSFPSVGIAQSAAGGAALLANQNQKSFEWWKPEANAGASKAAMLAKDYKMDPLWQPESSAAGSKAALLAHQKGHGAQFWEPTASDKALIAATGAVAGKTGKPGSTKSTAKTTSELGVDRYPDERNAAKNALSAATLVHSNSAKGRNNDLIGLSDEEAEKIRKQATVSGMNASLFGSAPLIGPELDEQKHQAGLHAAAVSMAQGMYGKRDKAYREKVGAAQAGARGAAGRGLENDSDDEDSPMSFMGLHEAAQKMANERLAKLQDPNDAYREHWGTNSPPPPKNRLSMFGGSRGLSSSDDKNDPDEKDSRRIRGEMNLFKDKLKEIDARKRKEDRQSLLAAAQRNVKKDIADMDEHVFQQTGKMSPAMKAEWEAKARARAKAESESRNSNYGKVALGGGKYLDQTEIDAIAQARLQPTLDAITAKAEHDREVDEEARADEEERRYVERVNKESEKEKDRKIKAEWKHFKAEEKAERKEREAKEKEERRKSKQASKDAKMQEKFEERIHKEEEEALHDEQKELEREAHEAEKEHDKQIKEQWKLFKRQEKAARGDDEAEGAKKENRFSSLFRRKSKKGRESYADDEKRDSVHGSAGQVTTTITGGAAAGAAAAAVHEHEHEKDQESEPESEPKQELGNEPEQLSPHHEEPHHNPLMPVEETPEARAANKQKPGGDLIQMFKRKKAEHDEKKRQSIDAGSHRDNESSVVAEKEKEKDEPAKEHSSVAPVAVGAAAGATAGAVATHEAHEAHNTEEAPEMETPGLPSPHQPYAMHALIGGSQEPPAEATAVPATTTEPLLAQPVQVEEPVTQTAVVESPTSPAFESSRSAQTVEDSRVAQHDETVEAVSPTSPMETAFETPAEWIKAEEPTFAKVEEPISERAEEPTSPKSEEPTSATSETSFAAMGSDKPVTSEIRRSIIDKIEPRVNAGKPGFEGSTKVASATGDMRGTDHAGSDHPSARNSSIDASAASAAAAAAAAAEPVMTQNATAQSAEAAPPVEHKKLTKSKPAAAAASAPGHKQKESVDERVAVPSNATSAAEEVVEQKGSGANPRQKEAKEKHRISGFFRSRFGNAGKKLTKEHKASDGVVVSPTTQTTTHGKYVDPDDKHSATVDAPVPANKHLLEQKGDDEEEADGAAAYQSQARGVAVDPAYQLHDGAVSPLSEDEAIKSVTRGRTDLSDEARDTVDEDLPRPSIPSAIRSAESPARETRFREEI